MRFFMKRIGKIFTLFLVLVFCFFGCKSNEEDSSSKKIIATFEAEYDSDEKDHYPTFINVYDDKTWDFTCLYDGRRMFVYAGTYEGNPKKDGFVNFIIRKYYGMELFDEYDENYVKIKNGKFTFQGLDFIRQ